MTIAKIMRPHISAITSVDSCVSDLLPLLFGKKLNSLPVLDAKQHLVGIVTREDVLKLLYPDYQEYIQDIISASEEVDAFDKDFSDILHVRTKDIMKKDVLTAYPDTPVMQALARMIANHVDQLPVIRENGKLVSIITKSDIFYVLYKANKKRIFVENR